MRRLERAQALVEVAFAVPVVVMLVVGATAIATVGLAQMASEAAAREAARAAASAKDAAEAVAWGRRSGQEVARGYGLANARVDVTVRDFPRQNQPRTGAGEARATVRADVSVLRWGRVAVSAEHVEPIEPYRARWIGGGGVP
jgi:Tfp pilus assembly protein PilV